MYVWMGLWDLCLDYIFDATLFVNGGDDLLFEKVEASVTILFYKFSESVLNGDDLIRSLV